MDEAEKKQVAHRIGSELVERVGRVPVATRGQRLSIHKDL
jgi:hypothetical protein